MQEASWVRSTYLYLMCAASIALIGLGAIASVTGLVHTVAPDLGHRDTLDRVGIGLANIATEVVDLVDESQGGESGATEGIDSIKDGIDEVKSELRSQIRNSSIDQMIRGLLLLGGGLLLFRIHGNRTELFADGLIPTKATPVSAPPAAPVAPAPTAPLPPPPGAPS